MLVSRVMNQIQEMETRDTLISTKMITPMPASDGVVITVTPIIFVAGTRREMGWVGVDSLCIKVFLIQTHNNSNCISCSSSSKIGTTPTSSRKSHPELKCFDSLFLRLFTLLI